MINRHKVFISYHHDKDQEYKNLLLSFKCYNLDKGNYESIFDDYSVNDGDIDDSEMNDEQIRIKIRDEYIKDSTVLVLLCGQDTKNRKHIDWEIHAAMFNTEKNPKTGIVIINLPSINQCVKVAEESEKKFFEKSIKWTSLKTREEYEHSYPYMPSRIIDNFVKGIGITVINWEDIDGNPKKLMEIIDNAYQRKKDLEYDHSAPLRRNNS